ncbi:MAG TPA: winged helix-turn-helix domain-containing protein [Bdellovibrio sp.]|nr:winged helix-turn-helix domain-containing protein [Bdellovibrio sp.]
MKRTTTPPLQNTKQSSEDSLLGYSLKTGIPRRILQDLSQSLLSVTDPQGFLRKIQRQNTDLAELALEQGFYRLALDLGLQNNFSQMKALLFAGKRDEARRLSAEKNQPLLTALLLRTEGQFVKSLRIFENEILPTLQTQPLWMQSEALLIAASIEFNNSRYQQSVEYNKQAFEIFEKLHRPGRQAIAAFNASISLAHLDKKIESSSWRWKAEEILETYHLENLEISMNLSRSEQLVGEEKYSEAQPLLEILLKENQLSVVQKLLATQALARSHMEQGALLTAEIQLQQARQWMIKNEFYQYEVFQRALELDLEVLVHHKVTKAQLLNSPHNGADQRGYHAFMMASARKAWMQNDPSRCQRLSTEIQHDKKYLPEDLRLLVDENLLFLPQQARAQEIFYFIAAMKNKISSLKLLQAVLGETSSLNPWQQVLQTLISVAIEMHDQISDKPLEILRQALSIAEKEGLERLATIALGYISLIDPHHQKRWVSHLNSLDEEEKNWIEAFFRKSLNVNIIAAKWVVQSERATLLAEADIPDSGMDILIYPEKGKISVKGQEVPMKGILLKLLTSLARAQGQGLSKENLVTQVWEQNYDPTIHDAVIYANIARLRDVIQIECHQGVYRLSNETSWALVEAHAPKSKDLNDRQKAILKVLESGVVTLQRNQVLSIINASERTALRELNELLRKGLLKKSGSGRAVTYRLANI